MKKLFIVAIAMLTGAAVWTSLSAQPNVPQDVNYYGVDFSRAKTFGASEPGWEFRFTFGEINSLVIGEWPKYDPGKFLGKNIVVQDISVTKALNDRIDPVKIAITSPAYTLSKDDIAEMVRAYEIAETAGTGLVIVGELLNKQKIALGSFVVVYFDIASREVLYSESVAGRASGFGLRNFWARALYNALAGK